MARSNYQFKKRQKELAKKKKKDQKRQRKLDKKTIKPETDIDQSSSTLSCIHITFMNFNHYQFNKNGQVKKVSQIYGGCHASKI